MFEIQKVFNCEGLELYRTWLLQSDINLNMIPKKLVHILYSTLKNVHHQFDPVYKRVKFGPLVNILTFWFSYKGFVI